MILKDGAELNRMSVTEPKTGRRFNSMELDAHDVYWLRDLRPQRLHEWLAYWACGFKPVQIHETVPDPVCANPACKNIVESGESYCTDCLDAGIHLKHA